MQQYNKISEKTLNIEGRNINIFSTDGDNIDVNVVNEFGNEWLKFNEFSADEIEKIGNEYFDILDEKMINENTYAIDIGCGSGRWSKYLAQRVRFVEAIDPSSSVIAASHLLKNINNIRITKASVETIPFNDETFDFGMSVGVLHHIPNTEKAMIDCVKKIKRGGYFYCYLYYNIENRGFVFKVLFFLSTLLRRFVSNLPSKSKKIFADILAVSIYMPFVIFSRILITLNLEKVAKKIPLNYYTDKSFYIIRNDSLDRFGTSLEQRFSKKQVYDMMGKCGLVDIKIGENAPYYRAVGRKP